MVIGLSCSVFDRSQNDPICPINILDLTLSDPSRIEGTWNRIGAASFDCRTLPRSAGTFKLKFTTDSVFVAEGLYDNSGIRSFKLSVKDGVISGRFLEFDGNVVLLTPGDTLLVDNTHEDGAQLFFVRD